MSVHFSQVTVISGVKLHTGNCLGKTIRVLITEASSRDDIRDGHVYIFRMCRPTSMMRREKGMMTILSLLRPSLEVETEFDWTVHIT